MNLTKRLLLFLLVLSVVTVPLFSCVHYESVPDAPIEGASSSIEEIVTTPPEDTTDYQTLYKDMSDEEFYANYQPAKSYKDA